MKKGTPMNTHNTKDDMLFTPLTTREASVSLAELKQYVATKPAPRAMPTRTYVAIATLVICAGVGTVFFLGDNDNIEENPIAGTPSLDRIVAPIPVPQAVTTNPEPSPVAEIQEKQIAKQPRRTIRKAEKQLASDPNIGLAATTIVPDPNIGLSQQFALECNDPSLLVAFARIDFSDPQDPSL